ncbi:MAG: hypothetical protein Q9159_005332 [Coniocarpon cinnabarinum]
MHLTSKPLLNEFQTSSSTQSSFTRLRISRRVVLAIQRTTPLLRRPPRFSIFPVFQTPRIPTKTTHAEFQTSGESAPQSRSKSILLGADSRAVQARYLIAPAPYARPSSLAQQLQHRSAFAVSPPSKRSVNTRSLAPPNTASRSRSHLLSPRIKAFATSPPMAPPADASTTKPSTSSPSIQALRPIILSGPSGAGKSTLINRLSKAHPHLFGFSISHTTRSPRPGEQNGREYHFIPRDTFQTMITSSQFLEHAQFGGNFYGTSKGEIGRIQGLERVPVLDIDMEGVKSVLQDAELGALVRTCAVQPPSLAELEKRLRGRGTETEEKVRERLQKAEVEMAFSTEEGRFQRVVVNEEVERAWEELEAWVFER